MMKIVPAASLALLMAGVAAPAPAQSSPDWSGPYIGIYGGVIDSNEEAGERLVFDRDFDGAFDDTVVTTSGADAFSPGSCDGAANNQLAAGGCNKDDRGPEGGVRLGYDFQFGGLVAGVVGEWSAVNLNDTVTSFSTTPANYVFGREVDSIAAIRARMGVAAGSGLYYVTAGAAQADVTNTFRTTNGANSFTVTQNEDKADGFQLGAGVEWRLAPGLSLTGEYMYTDLQADDYIIRVGNTGTTPATNPFILPPNTAGTDMTRSNGNMEMHALRIGMNLRF